MSHIAETKHGNFMVLTNDALGQALIEKKDFEPHFYNVAKSVLKSGDVCFDCGANLGYHTVSMAKLVGPSGRVFAFEPLRVIFQQLNGNVFLNSLRNVQCLNVALGNENKIVHMEPLNIDGGFGVNIGATRVGAGGDEVHMRRLDDTISGNVSFMKIDVQGCEVALLEGASNIINKSRPVIFIEVENQWLIEFGQNSGTLLNKLLSFDYVIVRINTEYPCDHVAVPREKIQLVDTIVNNVGYKTTIIDGKSIIVNFDRTDWQKDINYGSFTVQS